MLALALLLQAAAPPPSQEGDVVVLAPSRPSAQTPATMVVEPAAMFVAACDTDGDGTTRRDELEACVARSFAAVDTAGAGRLRYLAFADWAERYLGDRNALPSPFDVDRDIDGAVTLDELQRQFSRLYSRFNTDGQDGITRKELVTFRTAPVDAKGPAAPPPGRGRGRPPGSPPGEPVEPRGRR